MARRHNDRRVKINRSYTIPEVAQLLGVHKHTVSRWIKAGLPLCRDNTTIPDSWERFARLFAGAKQPAQATPPRGWKSIVRHAGAVPKRPAGDWWTDIPKTGYEGFPSRDLSDLRPADTSARQYATLVSVCGDLSVTHQPPQQRLDDSPSPSGMLTSERKNHDRKTPPRKRESQA